LSTFFKSMLSIGPAKNRAIVFGVQGEASPDKPSGGGAFWQLTR